jgi:hypothetical protein
VSIEGAKEGFRHLITEKNASEWKVQGGRTNAETVQCMKAEQIERVRAE